ncbi:TIGR02530 family flagellar biosynthesis protein [Desulfofundulus salinus]|uniref:Flagellar protein n=1 Tax=Desulfofundulus salinus TaxID=2419843 RepID=A0A494X1Y2_9FIRM|nr:TIGR02530 family flagellar biosynthesis protein [Desulfofundulus salinum]RKO66910.1 flagellar protein [Desulfofundulus salinum]
MDVKIQGLLPAPLALPVSREGRPEKQDKASQTGSFREVLRREMDGGRLKLSAHAEKRLRERNITLNEADMEKISRAVSLAASKGVKNSLVIYHDLALVTSVQNRTVVTALDRHSESGRVFTNIDGAIIVE